MINQAGTQHTTHTGPCSPGTQPWIPSHASGSDQEVSAGIMPYNLGSVLIPVDYLSNPSQLLPPGGKRSISNKTNCFPSGFLSTSQIRISISACFRLCAD
jgi:hypothetical protein